MLRRQAPWSDLQCSLLCSFSSLPHHFSLPFSASQTSIFPRYLAYGKSSSQTYLPHCHFNKLVSYTCSSNLFIWPPQILLFKHSSIPFTLFCHACAEGWDSNIGSSSCWCFHSLFPSYCLMLVPGWAHSVQRSPSACTWCYAGELLAAGRCGSYKSSWVHKAATRQIHARKIPQGHTYRDRDPILAQQVSEPKLGGWENPLAGIVARFPCPYPPSWESISSHCWRWDMG